MERDKAEEIAEAALNMWVLGEFQDYIRELEDMEEFELAERYKENQKLIEHISNNLHSIVTLVVERYLKEGV